MSLGYTMVGVGCNSQPNASTDSARPTDNTADNSPSSNATAPQNASATAPVSPGSTSLAQPVRFVDRVSETGVNSIYDNGEAAGHRSILESLGGGVGMFDFDSDGRWDLFFPGGGQIIADQKLPGNPNSLWRNLGDLRFTNTAAVAGAADAAHYSHGCAMGDFNSDGFADILVTGYGGLQLYRNQGDGSFQECAIPSGLTDEQWSSSAGWGDFNGDGHLDLFVVHYVDWSWSKNPKCNAPQAGEREICSPQDFNGLLDTVYFNNGDGTFRAANEEVGIKIAGKGLGVIATDVNIDGRLDAYVANDTTNNLLFVNQGEGKFKEMGVLSGTAFDERGVANGSMGVTVLDFDRDTQPDIWVTNYENETFALYRNDSRGMFRCVTQSTGITAIGSLYVGFGTVAADFTRSGYEDIVVSNGHVMLFPRYSPIQQEPLFIRNQGNGKLQRLEFPADDYFAQGHRGRGVVVGDLDSDGKLDLVFSHVLEQASILHQQTELAGDWLELTLVGRQTNRDAIGARVILETSLGPMMRTIIGGGSYLSQNPYVVNFGLPPGTTAKTIEITWPSGQQQRIETLQLNQRSVVVEP